MPWVLWLPAVLALALVVLPVVGLLLRSDLTRFPSLVTSPASLQALRLSLVTAALSTAVCVLLGVPLAVVLALLYLLGRKGFLGYLLNVVAGVQVPFTTGAVVIAQTFVAMPFLVVSLEGALRGAGDRYEQVAATLGARPWTVFRRVTVPLLLPALGSGMVLSFARALGEFGATITFAGSLEGVTRTLPLEVYTQTEVDVDSAVALSLLLIVVAVLVIALARPRALEGVRA